MYGLNTKQPFGEEDRVDAPASLYAATKRVRDDGMGRWGAVINAGVGNTYGFCGRGLRWWFYTTLKYHLWYLIRYCMPSHW